MNGWIYIESANESKARTSGFSNFECFQFDHSVMFRKTDGRFSNDKVFAQNEEYAIVLDGVLLNLAELKETYGSGSAFDILVQLYKAKGEAFMNDLRGPFSGVLYNKSKKESLSFANHTGDMAAFVFENEEYYVAASDFSYVITFLKENELPYQIDPLAVKYMLTFGFMIDSTTFAGQVKRIMPGQYVRHSERKTEKKYYFRLDNRHPLGCSMAEAVELVDESFRHAVKRCFDKDEEYGYSHHLSDMSAGFDSRMTNWVARELGYQDITNISYSQFDSDENKMASNVSKTLHNNYIHMQLDDASFIYDIDEVIQMNGGAAYYFGITGGNRFLSDLNFNKFGLEHTGQLGDVVIGSFCRDTALQKFDINSKRSSNTLDMRFETKEFENFYGNTELFIMGTRGFLGCLSTHFIRKNYTYAVSPFIDVDFLKVCFSLPLEYRVNHKLYAEWVNKKYPLAFQLPSSRMMGNITRQNKLKNFRKKVTLKADFEMKKVLYKAGIRKIASDPNNMNPFDYWYETQEDLQKYIKQYYEDNIHQVHVDEETKHSIEMMYTSNKAFDKLMALSVLSVNKNFFSK